MEDLYPGKDRGDGFLVTGSANVFSDPTPLAPSREAQLIAGFRSYGGRNLFVHQRGDIRDPSFDFRPLTTEFLTSLIEYDRTFAFSLSARSIGDVTYVSGAAARDYGGEVRQDIVSLRSDGCWSSEGLRLHFAGELGEVSSAVELRPTEFKQNSYDVGLDIPWATVRFLFCSHKAFVIENHRRHALGQA